MTSPNDSNLSSSGASAAIHQPIKSDKLDGYEEFMGWRKSWNISSFTEEVFIEFFREAAETLTPDSLQTLFFTLKNRMRSMHNLNIEKFVSLIAFLTRKELQCTKYTHGKRKSVEASTIIGFSNDEISKFLTEAPDAEYLAIKTTVVIGMHAGNGKLIDVRKITVNMVNDVGTAIVVQIPHKRTEAPKVYSIGGEFADIVRKYLNLRTLIKIKTTRFLVQFRHGKCCPGAMGRGTIGKMPQQIAKFLKLENPENYTTKSCRMISPKLVDKGFQTDATAVSRYSTPTCNVTGSEATSSNIGTKNARTSIDYLRLYPHADGSSFRDKCHAINVATDDETSTTHFVASSSEDDVDVIDCNDQGVRNIIANNCTSTKQQPKNPFHTIPSPKPSKKVSDAEMVQLKIDEQAKEIVRLKQLVEDQSLEIGILKDLLAKSMK